MWDCLSITCLDGACFVCVLYCFCLYIWDHAKLAVSKHCVLLLHSQSFMTIVLPNEQVCVYEKYHIAVSECSGNFHKAPVMPNPYCKLAGGQELYMIWMLLQIDNVSANVSKLYNKAEVNRNGHLT
jgi:hypothetical protein